MHNVRAIIPSINYSITCCKTNSLKHNYEGGFKIMKITRLKLATFVALLLNINQSQASALQIIDDANWGAASII